MRAMSFTRTCRRSTLLAVAAISIPLLIPITSRAEDEPPTERNAFLRVAGGTFDVLFLRPSGLATLAVGCVMFVPAAALASPGGKVPLGEALDRFVVVPGNYLFTRPIGNF
jgi:hypothetical protein